VGDGERGVGGRAGHIAVPDEDLVGAVLRDVELPHETCSFNGYFSGIVVLGNYEDGARPTQAALESVSRLASRKLGLHGVAPAGR